MFWSVKRASQKGTGFVNETVWAIRMGTLGGVITEGKVWRGCLSPHTVLMKLRTMHGSMCGTFLILGDVCVDLVVICPGRRRLSESEVLPRSTENGNDLLCVGEILYAVNQKVIYERCCTVTLFIVLCMELSRLWLRLRLRPR